MNPPPATMAPQIAAAAGQLGKKRAGVSVVQIDGTLAITRHAGRKKRGIQTKGPRQMNNESSMAAKGRSATH
jgi:hypothetical protein